MTEAQQLFFCWGAFCTNQFVIIVGNDDPGIPQDDEKMSFPRRAGVVAPYKQGRILRVFLNSGTFAYISFMSSVLLFHSNVFVYILQDV